MRPWVRGRALSALVPFLAVSLMASGPAEADGLREARIVSVGASITEVIYALGAGSELVAVDSTSRYPEAADTLPDVGYMRRLSAEPVIALKPTLVIASTDSGPPDTIQQLRSIGLEVHLIEETPTPQGAIAKIEAIAGLIGRSEEGVKLAAALRADFDALKRDLAPLQERPKVLFVFSTGQGAPLAGGHTTVADAMITLAGGRNAFEAFEGYKPLSPEAAASVAPDVLLVTDQTLLAIGGREAFLKRPEIAATPAGRAGRLVSIDGLLVLGFGPRTPDAARMLAAAFHPDVAPSGGALTQGTQH